MIEALLKAKEQGFFMAERHVLDMGCGTGVLGIMAKKCAAEHVVAVDIDDKSVANTLENAEANNVTMDVRLGSTPPDGEYDLIMANIHRNILIEHMPAYAKNLKNDGELWLSGFYAEDIPHLQQAAEAAGIHHTETRNTNEWQWLRLKKWVANNILGPSSIDTIESPKLSLWEQEYIKGITLGLIWICVFCSAIILPIRHQPKFHHCEFSANQDE